MATFQDNIKTIETAVYGKEMRPAISEALTQGWDAVKVMMGAVDQLNARVDALPSGGGSGGGGTVDPDNPDTPGGCDCVYAGVPYRGVSQYAITNIAYAGEAMRF